MSTGLPTDCLVASHVAFTWTSGDVADGAVTEAELAFDPATQAELDELRAEIELLRMPAAGASR